MTFIEREITINAPAEEVADYSQRGDTTPEWYAGVEEAYPSDDWPALGATMRQIYSAAGIHFEMTLTVAEYEYGRLITFDMDGMISGTMKWTLTPQGNNTLVAVAVDYHMPGGGLGQIADKLFVERMNTNNLEQSLENLRLHFANG